MACPPSNILSTLHHPIIPSSIRANKSNQPNHASALFTTASYPFRSSCTMTSTKVQVHAVHTIHTINTFGVHASTIQLHSAIIPQYSSPTSILHPSLSLHNHIIHSFTTLALYSQLVNVFGAINHLHRWCHPVPYHNIKWTLSTFLIHFSFYSSFIIRVSPSIKPLAISCKVNHQLNYNITDNSSCNNHSSLFSDISSRQIAPPYCMSNLSVFT